MVERRSEGDGKKMRVWFGLGEILIGNLWISFGFEFHERKTKDFALVFWKRGDGGDEAR